MKNHVTDEAKLCAFGCVVVLFLTIL